MDSLDRQILKNRLAKMVGETVRECLSKNPTDEDIDIQVSVENGMYYLDETGKHHSGALMTVSVDFYEEDGDAD